MKRDIVNARVTFQSSPIHVLERFVFKDVGEALAVLREHSGLEECVIVQTCNRVEIFGSSSGPDLEMIKRTWASLAGLEEAAFNGNIEYSENDGVYEHLLRLTTGLDSMVVGEGQILGQIRDSIAASRTAGASGVRLNALFDKAIRAGTAIRNSTGIDRGGTSVGSTAVKLVEENIDGLKSKKILVIGTGEVAALVAKSLRRRGYGFYVASRTLGRSKAFCDTMDCGSPVPFEGVMSEFGMYDVLFVATSAPYFLVTHERIASASESKGGGMMILDLSNPRTVDEKVATIGGVKLMNLDQIAEMVDKSMRRRINKVRAVESIISEEVPVIGATMNRLEAEPIASGVFRSVEVMRRKELQKALQMLGEKDASRIKIIENLTRAVAEGVVAAPIDNLRKASEHGDSDIIRAASKLFDYGTDSD